MLIKKISQQTYAFLLKKKGKNKNRRVRVRVVRIKK
jgi:hypothetical protein